MIRRRASDHRADQGRQENGGHLGTRRLWEIADAAGMARLPRATTWNEHLRALAHRTSPRPGPAPCSTAPTTVGTLNLAEDVVTEPVTLEGSAVRVSDAPGLGVTLDEGKVTRLRVD